jgi:hypothetical protein
MMTKLIPNIILHGTDNYDAWRHNLHTTLQSKKLWQFIEGTRTSHPDTVPAVTHDPHPKDPTEAANYDTKVAALKAAALEVACEKWDLQAQQTLGLIVLSLHSSIQSLVAATIKPVDAWTTLEAHYNLAKTAIHFNLYSKLTKLKPGTELTTHFARLNKLVACLKTETSEIAEDQVNFFTLNSLPSSFKVIKTVILSSPTAVTKDAIQQALLQHKAHFPKLTQHAAPQHNTLLHTQHCASPQQEGPYPSCSNGQPNNSTGCIDSHNSTGHHPQQTPYNPDTSCMYCLHTGHAVNDCWTHQHDHQDRGGFPLHDHHSNPCLHEQLHTTVYFSEALTDTQHPTPGWVFNMGATRSFSYQLELFHNYQPVSQGNQSVKLGNHDSLAILGHGTIHAYTCVKGHQINIVLHNMVYVLKLCTNILSPNALLANGFIIMLINRGCEVCHQRANRPLFNIEQCDGLLIVPLIARITADTLDCITSTGEHQSEHLHATINQDSDNKSNLPLLVEGKVNSNSDDNDYDDHTPHHHCTADPPAHPDHQQAT